MKAVWHGTAGVELIHEQGRLLFDPFVPLRGSPVDVKIGEFDGFSDIFVTHCHIDHVADLPRIVKRNPDVMIYCTGTPYRTLLKKSVPARNLTRIDYGQELRVKGFTVRVYHGKHAVLPRVDLARVRSWLGSPARGNIPRIAAEFLTYRENDETAFYLIEADGKTISLMGSMNLRGDVDYPSGSDLLVLPYNGWEDNFPPALRIVERLAPKRILLDHYDDTFPPVSPFVDLSPILRQYGDRVAPMILRKVEEI